MDINKIWTALFDSVDWVKGVLKLPKKTKDLENQLIALRDKLAESGKNREGGHCRKCGKNAVHLDPEVKQESVISNIERDLLKLQNNLNDFVEAKMKTYDDEQDNIAENEKEVKLQKNQSILCVARNNMYERWRKRSNYESSMEELFSEELSLTPIIYIYKKIKYREWYCDGNVGGCGHVVREDERNGKFDDNFFK